MSKTDQKQALPPGNSAKLCISKYTKCVTNITPKICDKHYTQSVWQKLHTRCVTNTAIIVTSHLQRREQFDCRHSSHHGNTPECCKVNTHSHTPHDLFTLLCCCQHTFTHTSWPVSSAVLLWTHIPHDLFILLCYCQHTFTHTHDLFPLLCYCQHTFTHTSWSVSSAVLLSTHIHTHLMICSPCFALLLSAHVQISDAVCSVATVSTSSDTLFFLFCQCQNRFRHMLFFLFCQCQNRFRHVLFFLFCHCQNRFRHIWCHFFCSVTARIGSDKSQTLLLWPHL